MHRRCTEGRLSGTQSIPERWAEDGQRDEEQPAEEAKARRSEPTRQKLHRAGAQRPRSHRHNSKWLALARRVRLWHGVRASKWHLSYIRKKKRKKEELLFHRKWRKLGKFDTGHTQKKRVWQNFGYGHNHIKLTEIIVGYWTWAIPWKTGPSSIFQMITF